MCNMREIHRIPSVSEICSGNKNSDIRMAGRTDFRGDVITPPQLCWAGIIKLYYSIILIGATQAKHMSLRIYVFLILHLIIM